MHVHKTPQYYQWQTTFWLNRLNVKTIMYVNKSQQSQLSHNNKDNVSLVSVNIYFVDIYT